jgi:hypothetical protein
MEGGAMGEQRERITVTLRPAAAAQARAAGDGNLSAYVERLIMQDAVRASAAAHAAFYAARPGVLEAMAEDAERDQDAAA